MDRKTMAKGLKRRAISALVDIDLTDFLDFLGTEPKDRSASTAFKTVLAEKMTEDALKAIKEARRRRTRLGAAAIIIAAESGKVDQ